ncbi:MAG: exosortase/archaeosortase family protein [bacterium]|nr:exosortase/archaeosortase family protein [bacterium]
MQFTSKNRVGEKTFPTENVLTFLVFTAFLILYRGTLIGLFGQWLQDDNYSHCLLVPALSGIILWRNRKRIPRDRVAGMRDSLPLLIPGLLLFVMGQAAAELFTLRLSMLLIFWGLVRGLWGADCFRTIRFPMLFLIFIVPLPYVLFYRAAFPLQLASAAASAEVLDFIGVPLVRTGNIIHLHNASLDVVTACSGLRSLLSMITFAVLAAGLIPMLIRWRILLIVMAVPIAMLTNGLRIVATAILVHTNGEAFLQGTLHNFMGLLTFAIGIGLLFLLGGGLRWRRQSESE